MFPKIISKNQNLNTINNTETFPKDLIIEKSDTNKNFKIDFDVKENVLLIITIFLI
jgi:hypothetical protein